MWRIANVTVGLLAAACAGSGTGLDEFGNPIGSGSGGPGTFGSVQRVFTDNCAYSGCHAGTDPQEGMNLSPGLAYSNIVNVPSREAPSLMRVRPFRPDSSYLLHKLLGTQAQVGGSGAQMPLGGGTLSQQEMTLIRDWIARGALNQ